MSRIFMGYELRKYHPDKGDEVIAKSDDLQSLDRTAMELNNTAPYDDETLYHAEDAHTPLMNKAGNHASS